MTPHAKSLVLKAQDNIDTARRAIDDQHQHDICGYNLAQAAEHLMKALMSLREIEFPEGEDAHDLDVMMSLLEEDNLTAISSYADVVELTPYNSLSARIAPGQRLNLHEYLGHVEDLKKFVGQAVL
jgi:HEPN domain-containing protein